MPKKKKLRAIDLYSGIGGWALGLRLAGIDVVASYELSGAANETNFKNNRHQAQTADIRRLSLDELPSSIDIVVGSPPCTQFSYSNRGGNGDIADGLRDIIKFLTIVDHLRPTSWAMENVPRVAGIIHAELQSGGRLRRFRHLDLNPQIINMEEFGLPQRRSRCIVGNFSFNLLAEYASLSSRRTLGGVVRALSSKRIRDPIYEFSLKKSELRDHVLEDALNLDEARINQANKTCHPVYNSMPFPDRLDRSVRTITATCTRVSRESIVIADPRDAEKYRRLTVRERASLQGFPITFQFYASTYGQKYKMIGNAIPPIFSYYVGHAMKRTAARDVPTLALLGSSFKLPATLPDDIHHQRAGTKYPIDRKFRFAIPSIRLKSGVRFELVNSVSRLGIQWEVNFYFGSSKSIHSVALEKPLQKKLLNGLADRGIRAKFDHILADLSEFINEADIERMQQIWAHRGLGRTTPFMFLDKLDECGCEIKNVLSAHTSLCEALVTKVIEQEYSAARKYPVGVGKLKKYAPLILSGLLIGSTANALLGCRISIKGMPRSAAT